MSDDCTNGALLNITGARWSLVAKSRVDVAADDDGDTLIGFRLDMGFVFIGFADTGAKAEDSVRVKSKKQTLRSTIRFCVCMVMVMVSCD